MSKTFPLDNDLRYCLGKSCYPAFLDLSEDDANYWHELYATNDLTGQDTPADYERAVRTLKVLDTWLRANKRHGQRSHIDSVRQGLYAAMRNTTDK